MPGLSRSLLLKELSRLIQPRQHFLKQTMLRAKALPRGSRLALKNNPSPKCPHRSNNQYVATSSLHPSESAALKVGANAPPSRKTERASKL